MTDVAIIDSGGANISSVRFALDRLGATSELTADAEKIVAAKRVILPGVGAARDAMDRLQQAKLVDVIKSLTQPVLGICLGMQLLSEGSEEEDTECLGVFPGVATKLPSSREHTVPNMGWCATTISNHDVVRDIPDGSHFYYVHSYALPVTDYTIATANHASEFAAMLARDNFVAAQFHPERSSNAGAKLLANFLKGRA